MHLTFIYFNEKGHSFHSSPVRLDMEKVHSPL